DNPDLVVLSIDPAISTDTRADRTALVVLMKYGGPIRCVEARAARLKADNVADEIRALDATYHPHVILFEANGAFQCVADLWRKQETFGPRIREVKQTKDKGLRVEAFSVPVCNGAFQLKGAP